MDLLIRCICTNPNKSWKKLQKKKLVGELDVEQGGDTPHFRPLTREHAAIKLQFCFNPSQTKLLREVGGTILFLFSG
jgi:hypothetical protein